MGQAALLDMKHLIAYLDPLLIGPVLVVISRRRSAKIGLQMFIFKELLRYPSNNKILEGNPGIPPKAEL